MKLITILLLISNMAFSLEKEIMYHEKDGVDAYAKGLGGAYITYSENASSTYWNPATITKFPDTNIRFSAMYLYYPDVNDYLFFSIAQKVPDNWGGIGMNYHYFAKENIKNHIFTISYAREIKPGISTGLNLKLYTQMINTESDFSGGIDAGVLYQPEGTFMKFGLVFLDMANEKIDPTYRIGFSYPLLHDKLLCSFQFDRTLSDRWTFHFGIEYRIKFLSIRMGLDDKFFSTGFGIKIDKYAFDYSFTKTQEGIKHTHRISINIVF